jgi:thioesterase domain-containing protein
MTGALLRSDAEAPAQTGREALWSAVRGALHAQRSGPPLERFARDRPLVASFAQRRMWFIERLAPGSATHNQSVVFRLMGPLRLPPLEASLTEIVRRHEALRTSLRWLGDDLIQEIHPPGAFDVALDDLRPLDAARRAERLERKTRQEASRPFDIDRPPLLRARLFRLAEDEHHLVMTMHHLAFDGWSFVVFTRELCALYAAHVAGTSSPLPELRVQYADYAAWQRARLRGPTLQRLSDYWTRQMRGALPVLRMPSDRPRLSREHRRGECHTFTLPLASTRALKSLAEGEGATLYMVLLAAFQLLLHRYTGEDDVIVGSPVANRQHVEVDRMIGLFVNTLALRTRIDVNWTFRELLARVRKTVLDAYEHQDLPFEMLIDAVGAASRTEMSPLFQVMLAFQNLPPPTRVLPELSVEAWNIGNGTSKLDLTLFLWDAPEGIGGLLEFDAELFDAATAAQWLRHFQVLLDGIGRDPDRRIAILPLMDDEERRRLLAIGNDTDRRVCVLSDALDPVPLGVAGEAHVSLHPTGDIVRRRSDGELEFLGRRDDQIVVDGFRVQPAEVEAVLACCPGVRHAAVTADGSSTKAKRLIALVVPAPTNHPADETVRAMRDFVRKRLPTYLVPSDFILVDSIPRDSNGNADRVSLRVMAENIPERTDATVMPRDDRERTIVEAFTNVLGRQGVGVDDDFFDFGGSSLLALRLVAMLERTFAVNLPLVSLYDNPTAAQLALLLAQPAAPRAAAIPHGELGSMLVEVKRGRAAVPLFLVPGGHGGMAEMTLYAKVLRHVGREQAVYGLLARGLDGVESPHASVAEMARDYVAEVRRIQPQGPYALAGECVGGLIAFEMAQRLLGERQEVALLLLLDTWCPTLPGVLHYRYIEQTATLFAARRAIARRGVAEVGRVLQDHVRDRPPFAPVQSLRYAVNVARTLARVARPWVTAVNAVGKPAAGAERIEAAGANYVRRAMRYRPRVYPGRITLMVSASNDRLGLAKPWQALAGGGLVVRPVPGDHDSYLRETPETAAAILEECIDEALGAPTHSGSMTSGAVQA